MRRLLAAWCFAAAIGMARPPSSPREPVVARPQALQSVQSVQGGQSRAQDSTKRSRHRRNTRAHHESASGDIASAFDSAANTPSSPPEPSRYRSRSDSLASVRTRTAAEQDTKLRIVISLNERRLWAVIGYDTLLTGPVAVSMDSGFVYAGQTWRFETPRGVRTVLAKQKNPVWIPPDWHYAEVAREHSLALAPMKAKRTMLSDGNWLEVRDSVVGLVNGQSGEFAILPTDEEIVFDETLFIPPTGTLNRRIDGELGLYSLDTGDGILLHGTPHKSSIGAATTHGCIRLRDEDIEWLFEIMPLKARVYIY
jgi:lipoprotein-anchoring transpeptidase ErfK/SrfK